MAANLHRMRGELNEAEAMVRAALDRHPGDALAMEFLGDLLAQKGDYPGAEAAFRAVLQDSPGRAAVEEKLARLILRAAPGPFQSSSGTPLRTDRSPLMALILSLLFPGAGHYYLGDRVKGLVFGALAVLLMFAMVPSLVGSLGPLVQGIGQGLDPTALENGGAIPTPQPNAAAGFQILLLSLVSMVLWAYAAIDSYLTAQKVYRRG
jgi:hypothetical protein